MIFENNMQRNAAVKNAAFIEKIFFNSILLLFRILICIIYIYTVLYSFIDLRSRIFLLVKK